MTYTPIYIKAPSEQSAISAVLAAQSQNPAINLYGPDDSGGMEWKTAGPNHGLKVDVKVWAVEPVVGPDGTVTNAGTLEIGWFANLILRSEVVGEYAPLIAAAVSAGWVEEKSPASPADIFPQSMP